MANHVFLVGRICTKPVIRHYDKGQRGLFFKVAVNDYTEKTHKKITNYFFIANWRDYSIDYMLKIHADIGLKVYVEGKLDARMKQTEDGHWYNDYVIKADNIEVLDFKRSKEDDIDEHPDVGNLDDW